MMDYLKARPTLAFFMALISPEEYADLLRDPESTDPIIDACLSGKICSMVLADYQCYFGLTKEVF